MIPNTRQVTCLFHDRLPLAPCRQLLVLVSVAGAFSEFVSHLLYGWPRGCAVVIEGCFEPYVLPPVAASTRGEWDGCNVILACRDGVIHRSGDPRRDASYSTTPRKDYTIANTRLRWFACDGVVGVLVSLGRVPMCSHCGHGALDGAQPLENRSGWCVSKTVPIAFGFRSHVACVYGTYQFLSSPYMTQSFCNQQSDRLFARIHHSNRNIRIWKITRITVRSKYVDNVQNPATLAPSSRKSVRR